MPRTALVVKTERLKQKHLRFLAAGKKMKKATRVYNRCKLCGRNRGYMGEFELCRICFRELAQKGEIPGVTKSSW